MSYKLKIIVSLTIFSSIIFPLYADIKVRIPPSIDLKDDDLIGVRDIYSGKNEIEIIIYSYSTGPVSFSYDGKEAIREDVSAGWIKAIVKLKKNGKLSDVSFIEAKGSSKEELISGIIKAIKKEVNRI